MKELEKRRAELTDINIRCPKCGSVQTPILTGDIEYLERKTPIDKVLAYMCENEECVGKL